MIFGLITPRFPFFEKAKAELKKCFGRIDCESEAIDFDFTDYYEKEFGRNLKRKFISFEGTIPLDEMPRIKKLACDIEAKLGRTDEGSGKILRNINIDPGYITEGKLVLVSRKDNFHRIFLKDGVYAEVTLRFKNGTFVPMETTYPDYRSPRYISIFNEIRRIHKN